MLRGLAARRPERSGSAPRLAGAPAASGVVDRRRGGRPPGAPAPPGRRPGRPGPGWPPAAGPGGRPAGVPGHQRRAVRPAARQVRLAFRPPARAARLARGGCGRGRRRMYSACGWIRWRDLGPNMASLPVVCGRRLRGRRRAAGAAWRCRLAPSAAHLERRRAARLVFAARGRRVRRSARARRSALPAASARSVPVRRRVEAAERDAREPLPEAARRGGATCGGGAAGGVGRREERQWGAEAAGRGGAAAGGGGAGGFGACGGAAGAWRLRRCALRRLALGLGFPSGPTSPCGAPCAMIIGAVCAREGVLAKCIAVKAVEASSTRRSLVMLIQVPRKGSGNQENISTAGGFGAAAVRSTASH